MKPKRIVDEALLTQVRRQPCVACSSKDPLGALAAIRGNFDCQSQAHHVRTKGSGGDDVASNLMALCARCHREWHSIGRARMAKKYWTIKNWLEAAKGGENDK